MKYVTYGRTGEKVSKICLGTMMFGSRCDETESDRIVGAALDGGITFIDTAYKYNGGVTEEILGRILKGKRDKVFLATKVDSNKPAEIFSVIDECLARLQAAERPCFSALCLFR
ncbi:MAG: aldo/keto reductase, partial [Planctomycetes bacterium]|nr:aldo/keto reductase [Planctomycetota bacterium]